MCHGRRSRVSNALIAAALLLLALSAVALAGCNVLDPDGGKTVPMSQYAPPEVKNAVLASLASQGFTADNPSYVYVTYASETDTGTVTVDGTFFGPSQEKGVVTSFAKISATLDKDGNWKVTKTTQGTAPSETTGEEKGAGEASADAGASSEATK